MRTPGSDPGPATLNSDQTNYLMQVEDEEEVRDKSTTSQSRCCGSEGCRPSSDNGVFTDQDLDRAAVSKKLTRALVVCIFCMVLETVGGSLAGSLAILSDAAHLLSDVAGFAISLVALRASQWSATPEHTYGYLRLEVLGALVSVQSIWIMTGYIVYEAVYRLYHRTQLVDGRLMCVIATLGVAMNLVMIFLLGHDHNHSGVACGGHSHKLLHQEDRESNLEDGQCHTQKQKQAEHEVEHNLHCSGGNHHCGEDNSNTIRPLESSHPGEKLLAGEDEEELVSLVSQTTSSSEEVEHCHKETNVSSTEHTQCSKEEEHNINLRGAYLHALGDLIQSVGVLITGVVIWIKPQWQFIDLLCSFFFSIVVVSTTFRMIKDVLSILMEGTPRDVDVEAVKKGLLAIQGVLTVHQLHVWALTTGTNVLTCHLQIKPMAGGAQAEDILREATRYCKIHQKMKHVTIQVEGNSSSAFEQPNAVGMQ